MEDKGLIYRKWMAEKGSYVVTLHGLKSGVNIKHFLEKKRP